MGIAPFPCSEETAVLTIHIDIAQRRARQRRSFPVGNIQGPEQSFKQQNRQVWTKD